MMAFDGSDADDNDLLARYASGDSRAARMLAARHVPRIMALAYRMLSDRALAEDIAQDTMMRLWKVAPDWATGQAKISTWIYQVAANLCKDQLRKRRSAPGHTTPYEDTVEPVDTTPSAESSLQNQQRLDALQTALNSLPERQRLAVTLRHIEGLSNPDIAAIMDISVDAVESLTARGKRALTDSLKSQKHMLGYTS